MKNVALQPVLRKMRHIHHNHKLPLALLGAGIMSICLTVVSVEIYSTSGSNKLDLSRPGYEQEREEVRQGEPTKTYDTTSPVNQEAIGEFLNEYDKRTSDLSQYGNFTGPALDDNYLQLTEQQ